MKSFDVYKDIEARTNGIIYLGVVGPVRTGKSTFIKRFMDLMVIPKMQDLNAKERAIDELPQSASGKTVMTAEPKFVPKEVAEVQLSEDVQVKIRLVDCVGYMVPGATGHIENGVERKVKTPWYDQEIPFTKAATIGTQKVIRDHATIGIVVTTDGSIGDIEREEYLLAEEMTIRELQNIGKPFVVLVNSTKPYSQEAQSIVNSLVQKYGVSALAVNCEQLKEDDIQKIMEKVLFEFPLSELQFFVPKWVEMLPRTHKIKKDTISYIKQLMNDINKIKDVVKGIQQPENSCLKNVYIEKISMDSGKVTFRIQVDDCYYYEMLSELIGDPIANEYELIRIMKELSKVRKEYDSVKDAINSVKMRGYGVVNPCIEEIQLDEPEIIKQGNKYGVKIHSEAPSIHMIRANIETEIAPIVGSEQQANDLIAYIKQESNSEKGIWNTNIFGKSIQELITEGMKNKLMVINEESQVKLQDTMQKIVNDSNGGMVCIII